MEALTPQPPFDRSSNTYPPWVILAPELKTEAEDEDSFCSSSSDCSKTLVAARTSTGIPIHVYLRLADPPAVSCVCLQVPDSVKARHSCWVLAAHGDSVLIKIELDYRTDHFIYNAGAAAADPPRPPSLSLLQPFHLSSYGCGLVRRGEDELVVAQIQKASLLRSEPGTTELRRVADLTLFRAGEWSVRRLQIRIRDASEYQELPRFGWDAIVGIGDRLLCCVDLKGLGIVLCDVFEDTPRLQYLPLPRENICGELSNRNVCATVGGDALKFINIYPRCCCGGAGASDCKHSRHAYSIDTWTMRISKIDDMEWVKDGMIDATELWALNTNEGLPRVPLLFPVMSMYESHIMCFVLGEIYHDKYGGDHTQWLLMVDMKSKSMLSVSRHPDPIPRLVLISSSVSYYLNPYPPCGSDAMSMDQSLTSEMDIEKKKSNDDYVNSMLRSPCMSSMIC